MKKNYIFAPKYTIMKKSFLYIAALVFALSTTALAQVEGELDFSKFDTNSPGYDPDLLRMGERDLASPLPNRQVVRMSIIGGWGIYSAFRIEGDSMYVTFFDDTRYIKIFKRYFSIRLNRKELDTLRQCLKTLDAKKEHELIGGGPAIDASNYRFEVADKKGYRSVSCFRPGSLSRTAPLYNFISNIYKRNVHTIKFTVRDSLPEGTIQGDGTATLQKENWLEEKTCFTHRENKFVAPKGDYTLHITIAGYQSETIPLHITADTVLDTIRLRHRRLPLKVTARPDDGNWISSIFYKSEGYYLYVNGVDTAIKGRIDKEASSYNKEVFYFDNIPGGTACYIVYSNEYGGGWYHSPIMYFGVTLESDTIVPLHMDFSRVPFASVAQKDSLLIARVAQLHKSLSNDDSLLALGTLFYYDFNLHWMPTWQTFKHAGDSAFIYLDSCYHCNPEEYAFLYYPLCQLENYHYGFDTSLSRRPRRTTKTYVPLPKWNKPYYHYGYHVDVLTPVMEIAQTSKFLCNSLGKEGEPSLAVPKRQQLAIRFSRYDLGLLYFIRVDEGKIYYEGKRGKHISRALKEEELNTLSHLVENVETQHYNNEEACVVRTTCPKSTYLEYSINGNFHHLRTINPELLPPVKALMDYMKGLAK